MAGRAAGPLYADGMDEAHRVTLSSYDAATAAYLGADGEQPSEAARLVAGLGASARVLEIGSGAGRDARWLVAQGLDVTVTDASSGFRQHLASLGLAPVAYDLMTDDLPAGEWDALLANAVLLHIPREDLPAVLGRLRRAVHPGCRFVLSLKTGREDGWSHAKLDAPRWFTYWAEEDIRELLERSGWRVRSCAASTGRADEWLLLDTTAG